MKYPLFILAALSILAEIVAQRIFSLYEQQGSCGLSSMGHYPLAVCLKQLPGKAWNILIEKAAIGPKPQIRGDTVQQELLVGVLAEQVVEYHPK